MGNSTTKSINKKIYIVIAAFNESKVIKDVINEVKKSGFKSIIVVDDGSSDETYKVVQKTKAVLLRHYINRGKGAAIKTGIEAAKLLGADIIITLDGDGQHDPRNIHPMVEKIQKNKYDVVLGSRLINHAGMPKIKVVENHIGNFFTWLLYGLWVSDSQGGFRAYSKKAFNLIDTKNDRYEYDSEVLREIVKHNLKWAEIPVTVRYTEYSMGKKNKQSLINGFKTLFRLAISS